MSIFKKCIGVVLILFALSSAYFIFQHHIIAIISGKETLNEWNAAPTIISELIIIGIGIVLITTKKTRA